MVPGEKSGKKVFFLEMGDLSKSLSRKTGHSCQGRNLYRLIALFLQRQHRRSRTSLHQGRKIGESYEHGRNVGDDASGRNSGRERRKVLRLVIRAGVNRTKVLRSQNLYRRLWQIFPS
jgi:hypothetical protein